MCTGHSCYWPVKQLASLQRLRGTKCRRNPALLRLPRPLHWTGWLLLCATPAYVVSITLMAEVADCNGQAAGFLAIVAWYSMSPQSRPVCTTEPMAPDNVVAVMRQTLLPPVSSSHRTVKTWGEAAAAAALSGAALARLDSARCYCCMCQVPSKAAAVFMQTMRFPLTRRRKLRCIIASLC